jgi:hypothetical protein
MSDSEDIHRKIVQFLGGEFARTEGRQCVAFELYHAQPGQRGEAIRTWDRAETPELFEGLAAVEGLAGEVIRLSFEHAESFGGGKHRFEIRTRQHLGGKQRLSFIQYVDDADAGSDGDEPPTERGVLSQVMRHQEVTQRTLTSTFQVALGTMSRMVSDMSEENRALRIDRTRHLDELEAARNQQNERDLEAHLAASADQRKDLALEKILAFLPIAAGRLLGGGGAKAGGDAGAAMSLLTSELAESLSSDPAKLTKLMGILSQPEKILLAELIGMAKKHRAETEGQGQEKQAAG